MKEDRIYLVHIREAIQDIEQYASVGRNTFMSDKMRQDALLRKPEVVGEAVKNLSSASKERLQHRASGLDEHRGRQQAKDRHSRTVSRLPGTERVPVRQSSMVHRRRCGVCRIPGTIVRRSHGVRHSTEMPAVFDAAGSRSFTDAERRGNSSERRLLAGVPGDRLHGFGQCSDIRAYRQPSRLGVGR
ncbi:MAG: DUF86 domain-containing protein [Acidimicrobiia bacterium]|nr:DUF86 domain-containing protein [Acidimicrobiia bacterium]